jgi:hypothetical protein
MRTLEPSEEMMVSGGVAPPANPPPPVVGGTPIVGHVGLLVTEGEPPKPITP